MSLGICYLVQGFRGESLITVDQPVGTGFSYVNTDSYLHELPEVSPCDDKYLQDTDGSAVFGIFGAME